MKKLLLIGPCPNQKDPSRTGGVIVLFSNLLDHLKQYGINYEVIDTNKSNYPHKTIALLAIFYQIITRIRRFDHVSLHGTANDYLFIAPITVFLAKRLGKSVSLRKFAGNFDEVFNALPRIFRTLIQKTLETSDVNFFETRYLTRYFTPFNPSTYWFPNVRTKSQYIRNGTFQKRFIFIGQITREKGIIELLEASNQLDDSYTVHLYGPLGEDMRNFDFTPFRALYQKALPPEQILKTLSHYDCLILPSYREGYPGVIIEALSVGLPIIATDLEGIKEMIDQKCAILVKPKSSSDIYTALHSIDEESYCRLSSHALECFQPFESEIQTKRFLMLLGFKGEV